MELKISEVIRQRRRTMDISQETLADHLGVSVQAVSKWETNASYPDITLLPRIAEYLKTDINALFFGEEAESAAINDLPNDGRLRILQCIDGKILSREEYDQNRRIKLEIPNKNVVSLNLEIWGSADIDGDIGGAVNAGGGINCGNIGGEAISGGGINCGNIHGGEVTSGGAINCGNIKGDATSGGSINCGNVDGTVTAGSDINCGDIHGNASSGHDMYCGNIEQNAKAENDIHCKKIKGDAQCGGSIIYESEK